MLLESFAQPTYTKLFTAWPGVGVKVVEELVVVEVTRVEMVDELVTVELETIVDELAEMLKRLLNAVILVLVDEDEGEELFAELELIELLKELVLVEEAGELDVVDVEVLMSVMVAEIEVGEAPVKLLEMLLLNDFDVDSTLVELLDVVGNTVVDLLMSATLEDVVDRIVVALAERLELDDFVGRATVALIAGFAREEVGDKTVVELLLGVALEDVVG